MDGLYSITEGGQLKWTVDINGENGMRTTPGNERQGSERGRVVLSKGSFDNPDKRGLTLTGKDEYNVEIVYVSFNLTLHGVVSDDGTKITMMDGSVIELMDEEEKKKLKDYQDPAENPSNTYTPQPAKVGKLIWISGPSGMGKTTTARILQEEEGFVNYEGDCFIMGCNPYLGASEKGFSELGTKVLSGIPKQRVDICQDVLDKGYAELLEGNYVDPKIWETFYNLICKDVRREREKLGGRWVVNQALYTRYARDLIRRNFGDDLTIVALESGEEKLQVDRISSRMLGEGEVSEEAMEATREQLTKYCGSSYENVSEDEPNTCVVTVTKSMTPSEVAKQVLEHVAN